MADRSLQSYAPYRTDLLPREALARLNRLRPAIVVRDTALDWAVILLAWAAVAAWPTWWAAAIAVPVIGTRFYGLFIIAHDGLHRRLFRPVWLNDLWTDLFVLGAIGAVTRLNRHNHMTHHRVTCLPGDPDHFKYGHAGKHGTLHYLLFLTGLTSLVPAVLNVFHRRRGGDGDGDGAGAPPRDRYRPRDLVLLAGWQAALIGGLTWGVAWWAWPVLWLLPGYLFVYRADLVRVFCEHSMLLDEAEADLRMRLISYRSSWLERQFFAPHNMNFHMAHHLWPGIPYYHLPEADRLIRGSPARDDRLVWRGSYLGYLLAYWRERARAPAARAAPG